MSRPSQSSITNPRARYDYELGDELIVGIALSGKETKALRQGRGSLRGAFVSVRDNELFLTNALVSNGKTFVIPEHEQSRSRKLLANKKQIQTLISAKDQGRTIVPIELLTKGRYIKLRIAPGKGKKRYDKREVIKQRDQFRDAQRAIK